MSLKLPESIRWVTVWVKTIPAIKHRLQEYKPQASTTELTGEARKQEKPQTVITVNDENHFQQTSGQPQASTTELTGEASKQEKFPLTSPTNITEPTDGFSRRSATSPPALTLPDEPAIPLRALFKPINHAKFPAPQPRA